MSAQIELDRIFADARAEAFQLVGATHAAMSAAEQALDAGAVVFPDERLRATDYGVWQPGATPVVEAPAPAPPTRGERFDEPFPEPLPVDRLALAPDAEPPVLALPAFDYPDIAPLEDLDVELPEADVGLELPPPPDLRAVPAPSLMDLGDLPEVNIDAARPTFAAIPSLAPFPEGVFGRTFDRLSGEIAGQVGGLLAPVRDGAERAIDAALRALLDGAEFPGPATLAARLAALREDVLGFTGALAGGTRSGWALPGPTRDAVRASALQWLASTERQTESALLTRKIELRAEWVNSLRALLADILSTLQGLRLRHAEQVLDAHRFSLRYAKKVTGALLKAFEAENFDRYDAVLARAGAELSLAEAELKMGLTRYALIKARQKREAALQECNELAVLRLEVASDRQEQQVRVYAANVAALRARVEAQKLPWRLYLLHAKTLAAWADAQGAARQMAVATVEADEARLTAASAELKRFKAQIEAFEVQSRALETASDARQDTAEGVLDEFSARVKSALHDSEVGILDGQRAVTEYRARARAFETEAKLERARRKLALDRANAVGEFEADAMRANRELALELASLALDRDRALAQAFETGAGQLAEMANAATSAMSGLAEVVVARET